MTKTGRIAALLAVFFIFNGTAHPSGDPIELIYTVQKIMLKKIDGQWITVLQPNQAVDMLSESSIVFTIHNKGEIPPGKYVNLKIYLSETVLFTGSDTKFLTKAGGITKITGSAAYATDLPGEITAFVEKAPTWTLKEMGRITQHLDFDHSDADDYITLYAKRDFLDPVSINESSTVKVSFAFDIIGTVRFAWPEYFAADVPDKKVMFYMPSDHVNELVLTVDGRRTEVKRDVIVFEF